MNKTPRLVLAILVGVVALGAASLQASTDVIDTSSGPVQGVVEGDLAVFRGIPYASAPVGDLRWQPPRAAGWSEVLDASSFGSACPQTPRPGLPAERMSEDCLTLNVWTRKDALGGASRELPVMVWIHGGGFRGGTGASAAADGSHFVRDGAVLVSINYRLGALGFFAHDAIRKSAAGVPGGNYGVMDMIAALEWVRGNIDEFGGDSSNVTIFGMSAGGMAVQLLMVAPRAEGLFHRAISMSGYGTWPLPRTGEAVFGHPRAEDLGARIATRAVGGDPDAPQKMSMRQLRALPAEDLVRGVVSLHLPLVDGEIIPDEPASLFAAGKQHDVPFMTGGASYDGAIMPMARIPHAPFLESLGEDEAAFRELYRDDFAVSDELGASRLFGDARYLVASRFLGKRMDTVSSPAYLYYYHFVPMEKRVEWPGSPHGAEVPPLFGNFLAPNGPSDDETRRVGAQLREAFVNFARTGAPAAEAMPEWPAYTAENDAWMVIGSRPVVRRGVIRGRLDLIEERYLRRVKSRSGR